MFITPVYPILFLNVAFRIAASVSLLCMRSMHQCDPSEDTHPHMGQSNMPDGGDPLTLLTASPQGPAPKFFGITLILNLTTISWKSCMYPPQWALTAIHCAPIAAFTIYNDKYIQW